MRATEPAAGRGAATLPASCSDSEGCLIARVTPTSKGQACLCHLLEHCHHDSKSRKHSACQTSCKVSRSLWPKTYKSFKCFLVEMQNAVRKPSWLWDSVNVLIWSSQLSAANQVVTSSKHLQPVPTNKNAGLWVRACSLQGFWCVAHNPSMVLHKAQLWRRTSSYPGVQVLCWMRSTTPCIWRDVLSLGLVRACRRGLAGARHRFTATQTQTSSCGSTFLPRRTLLAEFNNGSLCLLVGCFLGFKIKENRKSPAWQRLRLSKTFSSEFKRKKNGEKKKRIKTKSLFKLEKSASSLMQC